MSTATSVAAIERQLELRASPERVWRALTDADELGAWFGQRAFVEPRPGGSAWFEWEGHGRYNARVEVFEPPRRFHFRWGDGGDAPLDAGATTLVEFELEPTDGGGTILRLRESGFTFDESRWANVHGWLSELAELASHVAVEEWQAGIRRTYRFRSSVDQVWRAFTDAAEFAAWWGSTERVEWQPGWMGWFAFEHHGRFAMRVEAVEPPRYLAWSWSLDAGVAFGAAGAVVRTEWLLESTEDGGTSLHLYESGFHGPENHRQNSGGWDGDVEPALRRHLGES